jgi:hypothetical protein
VKQRRPADLIIRLADWRRRRESVPGRLASPSFRARPCWATQPRNKAGRMQLEVLLPTPLVCRSSFSRRAAGIPAGVRSVDFGRANGPHDCFDCGRARGVTVAPISANTSPGRAQMFPNQSFSSARRRPVWGALSCPFHVANNCPKRDDACFIAIGSLLRMARSWTPARIDHGERHEDARRRQAGTARLGIVAVLSGRCLSACGSVCFMIDFGPVRRGTLGRARDAPWAPRDGPPARPSSIGRLAAARRPAAGSVFRQCCGPPPPP